MIAIGGKIRYNIYGTAGGFSSAHELDELCGGKFPPFAGR
jgi:hypothetical protein